jgi:hypothetical protein
METSKRLVFLPVLIASWWTGSFLGLLAVSWAAFATTGDNLAKNERRYGEVRPDYDRLIAATGPNVRISPGSSSLLVPVLSRRKTKHNESEHCFSRWTRSSPTLADSGFQRTPRQTTSTNTRTFLVARALKGQMLTLHQTRSEEKIEKTLTSHWCGCTFHDGSEPAMHIGNQMSEIEATRYRMDRKTKLVQ